MREYLGMCVKLSMNERDGIHIIHIRNSRTSTCICTDTNF